VFVFFGDSIFQLNQFKLYLTVTVIPSCRDGLLAFLQVGLDPKHVFKSLDIFNLVIKSLICFHKTKVGLAFTMHFLCYKWLVSSL